MRCSRYRTVLRWRCRRAAVSFGLAPAAFVATATATGLLVDLARAPVYLSSAGVELRSLAGPIGFMSAGVLLGTFVGERILLGMSAGRFGRVVGIAIGLLGLWLLLGTT